MKILNCAISIAAIACAGCTSCETGTQSAQCAAAPARASAADAATGLDKRLEGTFWTPTFLKDQGNAKCPAASDDGWGPVFIAFGADGKVNGMSGVNFFGGSCKISLSQTDRMSLSGGELVFFKGTDAIVKFRQIENPKKK